MHPGSCSTKMRDFIILQNYPNPFNAVIIISYSIPEYAYLELKVYDILGREVTTLVNNEKSAGDYYVQFDGALLTDGVYIYTLQSGNYLHRMILLK